MARGGRSGDLYITIGGDVTPLRSAITAGKSILNEFGSAAIDIQEEVTKAFADMAANAPSSAKQLEQSYAQTFAAIRKNAQAVIDAPTPVGAAAIINANGAEQAAAAAEAQAAALRMVADAAVRADAAQAGVNLGARAYAVAAEADAQQAAQYATALRAQAQVLAQVEAEWLATLSPQQRAQVQQQGLESATHRNSIAQMELMHVVRGSMDQLAAGAPVTQVLAMHMGMLSQAAALSGESMGKFGEVMSGPWGIAITAGISLLALLAQKHGDAAKSAEKHKDDEETLIAFINGEKVANDALLESLIKLNDQEGKSLDLKDQAIRKTIELTRATLDEAQARRAVLQAQLGAAEARVAAAQSEHGVGIGQGASTTGVEAAAAAAEVEKLKASLGEVDSAISQAVARISINTVKLARDLSTHVGRENDKFDKQQDALEARYKGVESYSTDSKGRQITTLTGGLLNQPGLTDPQRQALQERLAQEEEKLAAARERGVAAAQELDKAEVGHVETAQQAAEAFKKAVIGAEGTGPNKAGSSAAGFGQFMPATWAHYFQQAYPNSNATSQQVQDLRNNRAVAEGVIDAATADYEKVLQRAGVQITQASLYTVHMLSAGDPHGTVALRLLNAPSGASARTIVGNRVVAQNGNIFTGTAGDARAAIAKRIGDSSGTVSSGAAAIDQALKEQADKALAQQAAFTTERDRLNQQILAAMGEIKGDYEQQSRAQLAQIDAEHKAAADKIASNLAEGKYGAATSALAENRAKVLSLANDQLAEQRKTNTEVQRFNAQQDELLKTTDQEYQQRTENLRFSSDMASTARERRDIELQIIDLLYQQKAADLEIAKKKATEAQQWGEVDRIDGQIAALPGQKAHEQQLTAQRNLDPLQAWEKQVPHTAAQINEALQSIEVQGLDSLASSISDVITGTESLGQAFKKISSEIISDIIQMTVKMLIFKAIGGMFGGGSSGGFSASAGMDFSGLGSGMNFGGFRASGGSVGMGQAYIVGEKGPELFVPGTSGSIVPSSVLSASSPNPATLAASKGAGTTPQRVILELNDGMLDARIQDGADLQIVRRYPAMKADTMKSVRERSRRSVRG